MNKHLFAGHATPAFALLIILFTGGCVHVPYGNGISIAEQGSFFVGGRQVKGAGVYDPTKSTANTNEGNTFWVDQMYVQYQIPVNARKYPLVFVHGGGGTGRVWETTPDGREGYQTLFVRRGYPVYIVDFPRRGRAGFPSFNGGFGGLDGKQVVANATNRAGVEYAWVRWRLGPAYPEVFPVQQFPMKALDSFIQHLVPTVSDDAQIIDGNSHFMFSDLNNVQVADQMLLFLTAKGLDGRLEADGHAHAEGYAERLNRKGRQGTPVHAEEIGAPTSTRCTLRRDRTHCRWTMKFSFASFATFAVQHWVII